MRPICKPLASKHHAELQQLCDRGEQRFPDLQSLQTALSAPTKADLADLAFAWARHVMALGGWGWWSVSPDGKLNPALVSWDKAYFVVPIDAVLSGHALAMLDRLKALPKGSPGSLTEVLLENP